MTIFSDNPHDRRIERFMTAIPNFKPRGVGVRFSESQILITVTAATMSAATPDLSIYSLPMQGGCGINSDCLTAATAKAAVRSTIPTG